MITDRLWTYVIVGHFDRTRPLTPAAGPVPDCSDSELIAMGAECKGWDIETQLYPNLTSTGICSLYCLVNPDSTGADATWEPSSIRFGTDSWQPSKVLRRRCVLLIVCRCRSYNFILRLRRQMIGRAMVLIMVVESKKQTIFGYKLHLLSPQAV